MQVCYVAFWDEITLKAQELVERRIGENGFIGKWRVVVVQDLPFADQRLNGKIPKVLNLLKPGVFFLYAIYYVLIGIKTVPCPTHSFSEDSFFFLFHTLHGNAWKKLLLSFINSF